MIKASQVEITPKLLVGRIISISDMQIKIELKGRMGIVDLPLRAVITDSPLELDKEVELFLSYARVL